MRYMSAVIQVMLVPSGSAKQSNRSTCGHAESAFTQGREGGEPDIACRTCLENSLLLSSMAVWTVKPHRMLSDYCQTHLGRYVLAVAV